LEHR
jgi:hypothetical protein